MGRERFLFVPFPRPVGPPFGTLTYPVGRVDVIHGVRGMGILGSWISTLRSSPKFGVSKKGLDTATTVATMCTCKGTTRSRGFEARPNYGRLRDGQSQ
jgi:hypothetical protein